MAKKHSVLKFIAASALAAVFAGMTASFFRKRREKRMDDGFDDFDSFDTYEEAGKKDEIKPLRISGEAFTKVWQSCRIICQREGERAW